MDYLNQPSPRNPGQVTVRARYSFCTTILQNLHLVGSSRRKRRQTMFGAPHRRETAPGLAKRVQRSFATSSTVTIGCCPSHAGAIQHRAAAYPPRLRGRTGPLTGQTSRSSTLQYGTTKRARHAARPCGTSRASPQRRPAHDEERVSAEFRTNAALTKEMFNYMSASTE